MISDPATETPTPPTARSTTRSFGFDVLLTTGGKVLFVLCGASITVLTARSLGPSGQGIFAVAYSLTLLLVSVGSLGLPVTVPALVAREPSARRAVVARLMCIAAVAAVLLSIAVIVLKAVEPDALRGLNWAATGVTVGALPAALATVYLQGVILGEQRMAWFSLVEVAQVGPSLLVLALAVTFADPRLVTVLVIVAGGRYVSLLVAIVALRDSLRCPSLPRPGLTGEMLSHAVRVYVVALLSFALIRLDLLIVNAVLDPDAAGRYSIAAYVTEALVVVPSVIATNLIPRIAKTDDTAITVLVLRVLTVAWGGVCLLSIPVAAISLPLVFGRDYEQSVILYVWLAPGTFFLGMTSSLMAHYWTRGYPSGLVAVWVAAVTLNVLGNLILLPTLGVVLASVLSSATYLLVLGAHMAVFAREVGSWSALRPRPRQTARLVRAAFTGEAQ